MSKKAGTPDTAPMIRAAFKRAVMALESTGRPLSTMVKEHLEKDFLGTLRAISAYVPKELEQSVTVKDERTLSDEELDERINALATRVIGVGGTDNSAGREGPATQH